MLRTQKRVICSAAQRMERLICGLNRMGRIQRQGWPGRKNQWREKIQSVGGQKIIFSSLQVWSIFIFSIWNCPSFPYTLGSGTRAKVLRVSCPGFCPWGVLWDPLGDWTQYWDWTFIWLLSLGMGMFWGNHHGCCPHFYWHYGLNDSLCPERTSSAHILEFLWEF